VRVDRYVEEAPCRGRLGAGGAELHQQALAGEVHVRQLRQSRPQPLPPPRASSSLGGNPLVRRPDEVRGKRACGRVTLDVGYRFINGGESSLLINPQTGLTVKQRNVSQQILVGVRYVLQ